MDIEKQFATDPVLEKEGVWFDIGDGAHVRVAAMNNPNWQRVMRAKFKGRERQLQLKTLSDDVATKLVIEATAETILLDWKGFTRNGEPLPYSREAAIDVLTRHRRLRDIVTGLSEDFESFKVSQAEDAEKNSETLSASASGSESAKSKKSSNS